MYKKSFALLITLALFVSIFAGLSVYAAPVATAEFFDSFGDSIVTLTDETEISAKITFTPDKSCTANVVAAMYAGNTMSGFNVVATANVTADEAVTIPVEDFNIGYAEKVKLFVWNGFDSVSPLVANPCTISRKVYKPFAEVEPVDGKVAENVTLTTEGVTANVPAGVVLEDGVKTLGLIVTPILNSNSGIQAGENEKLESLDIHVEGVAKNNTTPIIVTVEDATAIGLNSGNLALYHVENGETVKMTQVSSADELTSHNSFFYDAVTGSVTLALCSFSEIAMVSDTENAWNGKFDYSWYNAKSNEYIIANADQLVAFGAIVGGMDGQTRDSFKGKTVKLVADINIGDSENENNPDIIFYPIGYYNSEGTYEKTGVEITSNVSSFRGIFDGNGNTIKNFYQNTWEMKGDDSYYDKTLQYYNDAMGLFGYVNGGTVKNLIVENFSSDGEFTPTGVVAAYAAGNATFENISVFNCNPRVYNTGNGGIVGIAGDTESANTPDNVITFKNITVDQSNKISALWGSYDVACGGIMGMFRGYSDVELNNCHVAAIIDVYNDVCANYQYYWYRYSGMFIGSVRRNETDANNYTVAYDDNIKATNCTYTIGDWNEYWYCELVANSLASYTHDHQFSRLTKIESLADIQDGSGNWTTAGNFVIPNSDNTDADCYHIMKDENGNLYQHMHGDSGTEVVNGENILKEDRQRYFMPFNQMFNGNGYGVKPTYTYTGMEASTDQAMVSGNKFNFIGSDVITLNNEGKSTVTVGDLFEAAVTKISSPSTNIYVSPVGDESTVEVTYAADVNDWFNGTLAFTGTGSAKITITDYYYCVPTTATVTVVEAAAVDKFVPGAELAFVHEVQGGTIEKTLGNIFSAIDEATIDSANVEVTVSDETLCRYEKNESDWTKSTLTFSGTGSVILTITDNDLCNEATAIVTITEPDAVKKFTATDGEYTLSIGEESHTVTLGELFAEIENVDVYTDKITATVNSEEIEINTTDWKQSEVVFNTPGTYSITITDNNFCTPTPASFKVKEPTSVQKFVPKFTETGFTYRIGNENAVTLDSLFALTNDTIPVGTVQVTVETLKGTAARGTYTPDAKSWKKSTIKFENVGVVKVTITDNMYCLPTEITLEVVDAINATTAANATANNVVLLNNAGFGSIEVSGGYTLYGNGFTLTCGSDSVAADMGYSFVTLNNGTLDNVQIICPNFDYAALYKSNLTSSDNRSQTDSAGKTRYYNARSGVMVSGNSRILNSRISGGRASVNITGGNTVIDNSSIELGAVASILVGTANSVTLRDVTLVQKPTPSTHNPEKVLMGFSVLVVCDAAGDSSPITIEGDLTQYAWIDETDSQYVPSDGKTVIENALEQTAFLHDLDGDGKNESLNLGFAYMPESAELTSKVNATSIEDKRTNKAAIPYDMATISLFLANTYVYSYKNSNGTDESFKTEPVYKPEKYSDIINVAYSDTQDGLTTGESISSDGWIYELNVDLDKLSGYALDFSKLSMTVNGVVVNDYTVNDGAKPTSPVAVIAGGVTYTLKATVDGKQYVASYKVTGTETSKESPSLVASNYGAGVCVASSYGGTWSGAAPALEGIQIRYWSVAEKQYKTINLADYTPTTKGKLNGTNTTWTYSHANGDFTLTLTGGQVHSGNSVNAMPVVVEVDGKNKLFYVAASSKGLVNTGNSARTIPVSYSFKDNNNGKELTFSHTWSVAENKDAQYNYTDFCNGTYTKLEDGSSGGCVETGTLITLADGSQKPVEELTSEDMLLVWNLETGAYDVAPIVFIDSETENEYEVINLYFDNGTDVGVIYEHGFFDLDLGKYVYIDATNAKDYIGHTFVVQDNIENNTWKTAKLEDVVIENKVTTAWSPVTFEHLCYYTNGVLSMPGGIEGLFNIFDVDTTVMAYDKAKMQNDIETYGLFTFDDFKGIVSEIGYQAFNGDILKVAIGKGMLTWEDIKYLAERYMPIIPKK